MNGTINVKERIAWLENKVQEQHKELTATNEKLEASCARVEELENELYHIKDALVTGTNNQTPISSAICKWMNGAMFSDELQPRLASAEKVVDALKICKVGLYNTNVVAQALKEHEDNSKGRV